MTRKEKSIWIAHALDEFHPSPQVPLRHKDPYTLLVAVVLSAQCTDERVNQVTPHLFDLADNPFVMARIPVDVVESVVRPCGLAPAKSRAIVGLSQQLVDDHGGKVPADMDALEQLPGVGHKTASVVMVQAFGQPAFPVDTHIHRLAYRWGLSNGKSVTQTEKDLKKLYPPESWDKLHLQMILFGRSHCPARGHDPDACPICSVVGIRSRMNKKATP